MSSNCLPCTSIKQWEEASTFLAATLNDYTDLCRSLGSKPLCNDITPGYLAKGIDSVLEIMSNQLLKVGSTLAQTRNQLVPSLHHLPTEILSNIFINVVFDSTHSENYEYLSVAEEIQLIYRRLYILLGVCSTWRGIVMTGGAFWSLIPMVSAPSTNKRAPFELSLRRARQSNLHLVATPKYASRDLLNVITEYGSRLHKINFERLDHEAIVDAIERLLILQDPTESLTELSIRCARLGCSSSWLPADDDYVIRPNHPQQAKFTHLVGALSAFRICGAHFHWQTLAFSTRLVELHIDCITLGYDEAIYPFLQTLASASELRDLKIICLDTFYDPNSPSVEVASPVVLPRLQSLWVENSFFNTLKVLLPIIVPNTCHSTLSLNSASLQNNLFDHDVEMIETSEFAYVGIDELCRVLEKARIDILMLRGGRDDVWMTGIELQRLLKAIPALKTLKIHGWSIGGDTWSHLTRSQNSQVYPQADSYTFPAFESLQITRATISTYVGLQEMVASHPLQKLVLGEIVANVGSEVTPRDLLEERGGAVKWLKDNVPGLCLVDGEHRPPEFQPLERVLWRLW